MTEHAYEYIFNFTDITNEAGMIPIDENNSVIQSYSGRAAISGDILFYQEMNRVLGNLYVIRRSHANIGTLVSFVTDSAGVSFKVSLV